MSSAQLGQLLTVLKAVLLLGSALTVFKLYRTGLYRRYPFFFLYFLFRIPNSIWPFLLNFRSYLYEQIWLVTSPLVLIFYILIVLELYRLVLENYKGLYSAGRWAFYLSLAISIAISALSLLPKIKPGWPQRSKWMYYELATERGVDTSLAIFIILMLCFLSLFPIRLSRNVRVLALVYSIFFLSNTFVVLMKSLFGLKMMDEVNTLLYAVTATSVVAWLILLKPAGEEVQVNRVRIEKGYEERLLTHLDSLNSALLRSGGR
jgi:hypothetical protein